MSSRILIKNWVRNYRHFYTLGLGKNLVENRSSVICPVVTWRSYSSRSADAGEKLSPVEIPAFEQRQDEPTETIRARLLYQSRKRGMLENDLLLSTFAGKYLAGFTEEELKEYDILINCPSNDWDIYYWATGVKPIPPEFDTKIMSQFVEHVKNTKREKRLRQPNLY